MKSIFVLVCLFMFLFNAQSVNSQEISDTSKVDTKIFQDLSLQFQVKLLELSSFQGALISFKYHFNDQFALRAGFGLILDNSDSETERDLTNNTSLNSRTNSESDRITMSFPAQFLYYLNPENEVKVFIGLGPYYSYSKHSDLRNEYNRVDPDTNNRYTQSESDSKRYSVGLSSAYGVEWFFTNDFSLTAEYGFTYVYYFSETQTERNVEYPGGSKYSENSRTKGEGWQFKSNGVLFGLSIYF